MNIAKTPLTKRRNTEMEFSPEEQKSMGSINADLLKEILDEKLTQFKQKIVVLKLKQNY